MYAKAISLTVCMFIVGLSLSAQEKSPAGPSAEELAKKLANPVSSLISLPLQNNIDYGIGPHNGSKYTLNIQPVIPIALSPRLISSRVILFSWLISTTFQRKEPVSLV